MKRVFTTGGSGFPGRNLISMLAARGWWTTVYDLSLDRPEEMGCENTTLIRGDITDTTAVERSIPDGADAVFHPAGDTSHWRGGDTRQTIICGSDKAIKEPGYTPIPLVDMLADCHRWMIENEML